MKWWMLNALNSLEDERRRVAAYSKTIERCTRKADRCDRERLTPVARDAFVELGDHSLAAQTFLNEFPPHSALGGYARSAMSLFFCNTTANALLGMYELQVLTREMAQKLLSGLSDPQPRFGTYLDVGAGTGNVTAAVAWMFQEVFATEVSFACAWRLSAMGYTSFNVGDLDEIPPADYDENGEPIVQTYDLISLFNVLDRCQRPRKLLADIQRRMAPGHGRFILAVVLPFDACVEVGASARVEAPHEALQLSGSTWETSLSSLIDSVLVPMGFEVERVARVPYLCQGDSGSALYALDDAVLLLRQYPGGSSTPEAAM